MIQLLEVRGVLVAALAFVSCVSCRVVSSPYAHKSTSDAHLGSAIKSLEVR